MSSLNFIPFCLLRLLETLKFTENAGHDDASYILPIDCDRREDYTIKLSFQKKTNDSDS